MNLAYKIFVIEDCETSQVENFADFVVKGFFPDNQNN